MMLTPCWPSAGPIGGDGFAFPAATCSLMNPVTFFISLSSLLALRLLLLRRLGGGSGFLDLREVELDRSRPAEDRDVDANLLLLGLELDDHAGEVRKGTVDDAHRLTFFEGDARLGTGGPLGHGDVDVLDLGLFH